jgi:hypothetical protein
MGRRRRDRKQYRIQREMKKMDTQFLTPKKQ